MSPKAKKSSKKNTKKKKSVRKNLRIKKNSAKKKTAKKSTKRVPSFTKAKKPSPKPFSTKDKNLSTVCSSTFADSEEHSLLPGYLLIAFGFLTLPLNFGIIQELAWAKAWPLLLVLFGFAVVTKSLICRNL